MTLMRYSYKGLLSYTQWLDDWKTLNMTRRSSYLLHIKLNETNIKAFQFNALNKKGKYIGHGSDR